MEAICKHHQGGFCKFGDTCKKHHINDIGANENCTSSSCQRRHLTVCRFFTIFSFCKFGEHCAYKHTISKAQGDIIDLKKQCETLTHSLKEMSQILHNLEKEIETLKHEKKVKLNFKSEKCCESFNSKYCLKNHMKSMHVNDNNQQQNDTIHSTEILRKDENDKSPEFLLDHETWKEDTIVDCVQVLEICFTIYIIMNMYS